MCWFFLGRGSGNICADRWKIPGLIETVLLYECSWCLHFAEVERSLGFPAVLDEST
jgi:hypothetical protein